MSSNVDEALKYGTGKKTLNAYIKGLGLSLLFTFLAFGIVVYHPFSSTMAYVSLVVLAILQFLAQVVFFLRMNLSPEGRWNTMPFVFVIMIIFILVAGTCWIMYNLNYFMVN